MTTTDRKTIVEFLNHKRLAVVGVSRNARDFSRSVFREFERQGYDVVPVNPGADQIDGRQCFAHLADIEPPVDAALLFTSSAQTERVVDECVSAHVHHVWMHRGAGGPGAVNEHAVDRCRSEGISVVAGECPLMFLGHPAGFHRVHGFFKKLAGTYPR